MEKYYEVEQIVDKEKIKYNEELSKYTTMKVGGKCDLIIFPTTINEIKEIIKCVKKNNIEFFVLGNGSNVIVRDGGFKGVVIILKQNFCNYRVDDEYLVCQAGMAMPRLCYIAKENSLTGLEFAAGIPGTCGGCTKMNAGAYGSEMANVIYSTTYLDSNLELCTIYNKEHEFAYRHSIFLKNKDYVILEVTLKLNKGNAEEIKKVMDENNEARRTKQPLEYPSSGSVFKRPVGYFVGKLVNDSGLRGYRQGGAMVSEKHCGFIINYDNATATDVLNVIKHVQKTVYEKFAVSLTTEVEVIGED